MKAEKVQKLDGPLHGIKVIECGIWIQGPVASQILGDLGANVIKVEEREVGDDTRGMRPDMFMDKKDDYGYVCLNRNKRSIALDLRKERGREIIYKLVERADVFITNFQLGIPEKLGIDYQTISIYSPQIIYSYASGWGTEGTIRDERAFEASAFARSSVMYCAGEADMPPIDYATATGDILAGWVIVQGILATLLARERFGIGQKIDTSVLGAMIAWQTLALSCKLSTGMEFPRKVRSKRVNPLYNYYKCRDDKWIFLTMPQSDRYWPNLCKTMGIERLENAPKFSNLEARTQNAEGLISILDNIFATKPRDEWMKLFKDGSLIFGPIQTASEVINDPQVLANEYITDFDDPSQGRIRVIGLPYKFSKTPGTLRWGAPELGQHTEEILLELGYSWDDIDRLREEQVI